MGSYFLMDAERSRAAFEIVDGLPPRERIELIENLYTANLTGEEVLDQGDMALRLKDLAVGDFFVCMPSPEDGKGNGGLKNELFIYKKIKNSVFRHKMDLHELRNTERIKDGTLFTIHPACWVLKISF